MTAPKVIWPASEAVFGLAAPAIMRFEGFKSKPYLCSAGKATIGYGTTRYPNGWPVGLLDKPCTEQEARTYLRASMQRVLADLQKPLVVTRTPSFHQAAAILILAYNIGVGVRDGIKNDLADSSLLAYFNRGAIAEAAQQFPRWNKAHVNGKLTELAGLTTRRLFEQKLFLTPD